MINRYLHPLLIYPQIDRLIPVREAFDLVPAFGRGRRITKQNMKTLPANNTSAKRPITTHKIIPATPARLPLGACVRGPAPRFENSGAASRRERKSRDAAEPPRAVFPAGQ